MKEEKSTGTLARQAFGFGTPEADTKVGVAFAGSLLGGLIEGAIFWIFVNPEVGILVLLFSLASGIFREVARYRSAKAATKAAKSRKGKGKSKKRKR